MAKPIGTLRERLAGVDSRLHDVRRLIDTLKREEKELIEARRGLRAQQRQEQTRSEAALRDEVIKRLDTGMTNTDIARHLGCRLDQVERYKAEWRKAVGSTIRPLPAIPERRRIR